MKPGDKVVCVRSGVGPYHENVPVVGEIYTIRELTNYDNVPGYKLVEIVNWPNHYETRRGEPIFDEASFAAMCFRPVQHTYGKEVCEKLEKELSETLIPESV